MVDPIVALSRIQRGVCGFCGERPPCEHLKADARSQKHHGNCREHGPFYDVACMGCVQRVENDLGDLRPDIDELIAGVTEENKHPETDWGGDLGKEDVYTLPSQDFSDSPGAGPGKYDE